MMKKTALLVCTAAVLSACVPQNASVSQDAVEEMLASPHLMVTPFVPAWLHDEPGKPLLAKTRERVCAILQEGERRHVPEVAYQTDDEHHPLVKNRFYLYASNGQCLAGTVMTDRVVMHDVVLPVAQERELYSILEPYLEKVFNTKL